MRFSNEPARTYTKDMQTKSVRVQPTQRQMGEINAKVRKQVNDRSMNRCERCHKHKLSVWTLEQAHIDSRVRITHKTTANDLARLCGPSTESGTCHHWVESTQEGKSWMKAFQSKLLEEAK